MKKLLILILLSGCASVDMGKEYQKKHADKTWAVYQSTWKKRELKNAKESAKYSKRLDKEPAGNQKFLEKIERIKGNR